MVIVYGKRRCSCAMATECLVSMPFTRAMDPSANSMICDPAAFVVLGIAN